MLVLCINKILNWCQITTGVRNTPVQRKLLTMCCALSLKINGIKLLIMPASMQKKVERLFPKSF